MKALSSIIGVTKTVVKYAGIAMAIIKAITVFSEELEKLELDDKPKTNE